MLKSSEFGYAVMDAQLQAYSFEDESLEVCKKYCLNGNVVVRLIPRVCGFRIVIKWVEWYRPIRLHAPQKNVLWLHWWIAKEYKHEIDEIVYSSAKQ